MGRGFIRYNVHMIAFRHHSRYASFRRPQGALPCRATVAIEAECGGDGAFVQLRFFTEDGGESFFDMPVESGRARVSVTMPDHPCLAWYFFVIHTGDEQTFYYGAESGEGMFVKHEPRAYQITVYDGAFTTPAHWREGIVYQIFPDRFKRSSWEDFRNRAQYHTRLGRFLRLHDRWNEALCYSPSPGQLSYAPDDFYGGDLEGIREKLPYLHALGVTTLYLNPVFESPSNHRYDTADYHRIDPILGDEAAFRRLCREAKARGMRIMLDGVFSHTGADSRYFDRFSRYDDLGAYESEDSPYRSWYTFDEQRETYECWWGFPSLPNVRELEPSYTDFIAGEHGVLAHWAEAGAVDWRLDVADELPDAFIRLLRRRLKTLDPSAVLLGEVWDDCSNKYGPTGRRGYVDGDALDCAMNYPFAEAVITFLAGGADAYAFNNALQSQRERYPRPFYEACLNLISSHDIVRAATALSGAPDRTSTPRALQAAYRPEEEAAKKGFRLLVLAAALQAALPGVPCVYYGDEAGMSGMADPFNRAPYPWGEENPDTMRAYEALLHARRDTPALRRGLCRMGALSPDVFALVRYLPETQTQDGRFAALLINRGPRAETVTLRPERLYEGPDGEISVPLPDGPAVLTEALTGERAGISGGALHVTLPPECARLYIDRGATNQETYADGRRNEG